MFLFFKVRAEKGISRHIYSSGVVWILIDNGKLANQFARLAAIAVKSFIQVRSLLYTLGGQIHARAPPITFFHVDSLLPSRP